MSSPAAAAPAADAEEAGPSQQNGGRWSKSISEKDTVLAIQVASWLRKRGKALRPKLNDEQKAQLEECFELMDADGSGAIDADELGAAFKLLGLQVGRAEIGELLAEVDSDGSGEVEYPEFIEIMTHTLARLAERKEAEGSAGNQVPFALLATAYRRKRIMEGLISGDKDMTAQVVAIAEEAARRAAEEAATHQAQQRHPSNRSSATGSHSSSSCHNSSRNSSATGSVQHGPGWDDSSSDSSSISCSSCSSSLRAAQAAAPHGLLRSLQKLRSMKNSAALLDALAAANNSSSNSSSSCSSDGKAGTGDAPSVLDAFGGDLAALLGEEEHAQLVEVLRHAAQQRLDGAQPAGTSAATAATASPRAGSGRSSPSSPSGRTGGSTAAAAAAAAAAAVAAAKHGGRGPGALQPPLPAAACLVGGSQHMTSKLQQKVLTQEVQVPKFALSMPRSGASSPSAAAAAAAAAGRSRARSASSSPVPRCPSGVARTNVASPSSHCHAAAAGSTQVAALGLLGPSQAAAGAAGDCTIHEYDAVAQAVPHVCGPGLSVLGTAHPQL